MNTAQNCSPWGSPESEEGLIDYKGPQRQVTERWNRRLRPRRAVVADDPRSTDAEAAGLASPYEDVRR
jgi:hypothetical protein